MLRNRDECCDENRYENRFERGFECLRESLQGSFRAWVRVCIQVCLHAERECCVRALVNHVRVDNRDCTCRWPTPVLPWTRQMQVKTARFSTHTPRAVAMNAGKLNQVELWQLDECDSRIKAWEAREIQLEVRVGPKRESLSKLVARLKYDCIDDDAEDERDEEVLCDCLFPQFYANPGVSPLRRRTERGARRDSCAVASFRTARRREVQTSSRVVCDICERSVSSFHGCSLSDSGQSQDKREQFIRAGCWTLTGIERWECHECSKLGHLRTDCSVCRERKQAQKRERVEATAVVQRVMVETSEYDDSMLIGSRFGYVSESTTRGTTPPLSPISGSSIELRGCKMALWKERRFSTLVVSSRLVPVISVLSLERNETSVAFTCSGDYDPSRQPKPLLQSSRVSLLTDQMRSGTYRVQANWRVTVEGKSSVNKLAGVFPSQITTMQEGLHKMRLVYRITLPRTI